MADQGATHKESVQVITETPRGSRNKYKMDEQSGRIKLSKIMPEGMVFPYDFASFLKLVGKMAIHWMSLSSPTNQRFLVVR